MKNAYITLLDNDSYIYTFIACYTSWKKTKSKYPFYCAYTKNISPNLLKWLNELEVNTIELPILTGLDYLKKKLIDSHFSSWVPALQKLAIYGLEEFDKLIFLDADTYIYKNLDHLFDYPHLTGVPDGINRNTGNDKFVTGDNYFKKINAGMLVIEPSKLLLDRIIEFTKTLKMDRPWADQNIISELYPNWINEPEKHLPVYYNCFGRHIFEYEQNIPDFNPDDIYVLHLVGKKISPDYFFDNVFNKRDGVKHSTYFKLLVDICNNVNSFIEGKQREGKLRELNFVKLPRFYDLIVPYVNSNDINWINLFNAYNHNQEKLEGINATNRFRGQGDFFKYFFEGVDKYAPWIRYIYLVVQSESQVPAWISKYEKVKVIYHSDFIPKEYLPTFNSTCIEMFIPFIPNLSEYFLYANDDMFFYNKTEIKDFYTDDIPFNDFYYIPKKENNNLTIYDNHCLNNYSCAFNVNKDEVKEYLTLHHVIRPYRKSTCVECFEKNKKLILNSITRFRSKNNFNMYLYDLYALRNSKERQGKINCATIFKFSLVKFVSCLNKNPLILCIEDCSEEDNVYENIYVKKYFYDHYVNNVSYFGNRTINSGKSLLNRSVKNKLIISSLPSVDDWM